MECPRIQKEREVCESYLEHRPSSYTLSEMQQSVSIQTTRRVHLTNQRWSILRSEEAL